LRAISLATTLLSLQKQQPFADCSLNFHELLTREHFSKYKAELESVRIIALAISKVDQ
jgi:hypothetical protein